jgi:phage-related protein
MITTVVNTMTTVLNGFALIFGGIVEMIRMLIEGDWAGAWAAAGTIVDGFTTYLTDLWNGLATIVTTIFTAIYDTVINTLTDMGVNAQALVESIRTWWADKFGAMNAVVNGIKDALTWLQDKIGAFRDWIGGISIPNPFQGILDTINSIRAILPGWAGGSSYASGTSWARGGLTEVGERGREFIIPPAGSKVLTNGQSNRLAAQEGSGRVVNITVNGAPLRSERDGEQLAYRLLGRIATESAASW